MGGGEGTAGHTGCFIYNDVKRPNNAPFLGIVGFEGIPQNFAINLFFWLLLHILFIILRKKAWNYGRMAILQEEEIKWADMFYMEGDDDSLLSRDSNPLIAGSNSSVADMISQENVPREEFQSVEVEQQPLSLNGQHRLSIFSTSSGSEPRYSNGEKLNDDGYFAWIGIVFKLTDSDYRMRCGEDCVYYLSFQRHLIFLASVITFFSLVVVLPLNLHRTLLGEVLEPDNSTKRVGFSDTTIINLGARYEFLWFHISLSMLFLFISVAVMRHFSRKLKFSDADNKARHTISIIGLNKKHCDETLLRSHLEETYPGTEIAELSFAYDISALQVAEFQRLSAFSAKVYFEELHERKQKARPRMRPHVCGATKCFCCCKDVDAIDYYTEQLEEFSKQVELERKKALTKPLGIVYVTFKQTESAESIVEDYACSARLFLNAPVSQHTKDLHSNRWIVKFAPEPKDICWENLATDYKWWYTKFALVNIAVAIIAIIFSTPVSIFKTVLDRSMFETKEVSGVNTSVAALKPEKDGMKLAVLTGILWDTLPALFLWIMSVSLIAVVCRSDVLIGFWTKTAGNLSEMIKTFFFLCLMIVILPSLGITSIKIIFDKTKNITWSCIFYKDNGAFFVNYVCTSSLAGTAAELMRLPELLVYVIKLRLAKSEAETAAIRKSLLWDFQVGISYAWTMLHFAIFTCFSVIYPLVTPFGLIYLLLKHFTDRYNIYFAYAPCKVDKDVHATAVNFVIMSMFMLQLNLLAYVHFHIGENQYHDTNLGAATDSKIRSLQICTLLEFSVTAAFFLGQCCFNICADLSPFSTRRRSDVTEDEDEEETDDLARDARRKSRVSTVDFNKEIDEDAAVVVPMPQPQATAVPAPPTGGNQVATVTILDSDLPQEGMKTLVVPEVDHVRPYGRYTPPLLRPELVRLALLAIENKRAIQEELKEQMIMYQEDTKVAKILKVTQAQAKKIGEKIKLPKNKNKKEDY